MMPMTVNKIIRDPAVAIARQAMYRFAALTLLDPKFDSWRRLDSLRDDAILPEAAAVLRDLPEAVQEALTRGEQPLSRLEPIAVLADLPHSPVEFNHHFENIFGLLVSNACPPYEMEYIDSKFTFQRSNALADISGFYRAFGITTSQSHPERPDHIVQELEFMAFLIGLERRAAAENSLLQNERMQACHEAQLRFFRDHLAWWTPAFALLLRREDSGGFYESVAIFLSALIAAERSLFGIEPAPILAAPSELERPEACDGCLLTS